MALATRPPKALRWSSREGALAPDRIETSPVQGGGHLTRSRYARWRSLLDHRRHFGGRVGKARWRLTVSRPHLRRAVGISPGLDTLAGARYSTTETSAVLELPGATS